MLVNHKTKRNSKSTLSNKFKVTTNKLINPTFNKVFQGLVDSDKLIYGKDPIPFVNVLQNKELCEYQSQLLRSFIKSPESNLVLDCDKLTFTSRCTEKDINQLLDPDVGIKCYRINCIAEILDIKKGEDVGGINDYTEGPNKPYYNHCIDIMILSGEIFKIYIADGEASKNGIIGIRIDFIPERYSEFELRLIFGHIRSVLKTNRYKQIMSHARVTRVDAGFNMQGVFFPFIYATLKNRRFKIGRCYPCDDGVHLSETCYFGSKKKSSYFIVYDKALKELVTLKKRGKEITEGIIQQLAAITRVEYKYYPDRSNIRLPLVKLGHADIKLHLIKFVDPKALWPAEEDLLANLLRDKTHLAVKHQKQHLKKSIKGDPDDHVFSLSKKWGMRKKSNLLENYLKQILTPQRVTAREIEDYLNNVYKSI
jgi:hypothetical protein